MDPVPPQVRIVHVRRGLVPARSRPKLTSLRRPASDGFACGRGLHDRADPAAAPMTIALGRQAGSRPRTRRDREGADLSAEGPVAPGSALPAIVMTEFLTHGELDRRGLEPGGPRRPATTRALADPPGRAPATSAGSPSRPSPSSTCTRSTTGARASAGQAPGLDQPGRSAPRDPPLEELRPRTASIPSARHSTSSEPYGSAFVPSVFHRFNPFWPDPEPFLSDYRGTLRIPGRGPLSLLHVEPGLQLPADRREGRGVRPRAGTARSDDARIKGEVDLTAGNARIPVPSRGRRSRRLHGRRLAAAGVATSPSRSPRGLRLRGDRVAIPRSGVKHLHEYTVDIARRGAPGRERPAPGPRPVPPRSRRAARPPGPRSTGTSATARRAPRPTRSTSILHPGLYTVTMKVSRRSRIPGGRQPRADPSGPGLRRRTNILPTRWRLPGDPRQVRSGEARSRRDCCNWSALSTRPASPPGRPRPGEAWIARRNVNPPRRRTP